MQRSVVLNRLKVKTEEDMSDEQAGFRKDRSTVQQILMLRLIAEKAKRKQKVNPCTFEHIFFLLKMV